MSRVKIDDLLKARLDSMEARPEMWGGTRESFGLQLLLIAEMQLWEQDISAAALPRRLMGRLFGPGNVVTAELLDSTWAKNAVGITRALVKEIGLLRNSAPNFYGLLRVHAERTADRGGYLVPLSYTVGDQASFEQATVVDREYTIAFCTLHASSLEEARSQLKADLPWFEPLLVGAVPEAWFSSEDPS